MEIDGFAPVLSYTWQRPPFPSLLKGMEEKTWFIDLLDNYSDLEWESEENLPTLLFLKTIPKLRQKKKTCFYISQRRC